MSLTERQLTLLHLVVQHFDHDIKATYLDPVSLEEQLRADITDLAEDIDVLEDEGYVERTEPTGDLHSGGDAWVLSPTDKGVLTAMGLAEE